MSATNPPTALEHYTEQARLAQEVERDAARYQWLRSEEVSTNPFYYGFWNEFAVKLRRESALDELIDTWMKKEPTP